MSEAKPQTNGPPTELGTLRVLASTAGIRVSPLVMGGGNIGEKWNNTWGYMDKEGAMKLLDAYYDAGGNFIDTSNGYQAEQSETWIGEWLNLRQNRDSLVLCTKYTSNYKHHYFSPDSPSYTTANHGGNHRRSLQMSVRDSLAKLQTSYIDILYLHWWDYTTSIEEVMDSLHMLVEQGKVMYLGVSDTPAWVVGLANGYARERGKTQFSVYSGRWNVVSREFEREVLPMARYFGMAVVPWGVLGMGKFQSERMLEEREKVGEGLRPHGGGMGVVERRVSEALERVGKGEVGGLVWEGTCSEEGKKANVTQVALAYVLKKGEQFGVYNVFPVLGGRKVAQWQENIAALGLRLTDEQVEYLESVKEFEVGFPHDFIGRDPNVTGEMGPLSSKTTFMSFPGARPGKGK